MIWLAVLIFLFWCIKGLDFLIGVLWGIPALKRFSCPSPPASPKISIIFAARNEEDKVRDAVMTMLNMDYPDYEVIAVNDRSEDQTLALLQDAALTASFSHFRIVNIETLPEGWIGKNHALYEGAKMASGQWLLFTDADVHFDPGTLKAAMNAVSCLNLDHLALFPWVISKNILESLFVLMFSFIFYLWFRPWAARNARSRRYVGIGSFNLLKREVYEEIGTHRSIPLEVADDMMLGRRVKERGFKQMIMNGGGMISERWVEGFKGIVQSLEKNGFAGLHYNLFLLAGATLSLLLFDVAPFVLVFVARSYALYFIVAALGIIFAMHLATQKDYRFSVMLFPFHAFGSLLILWIIWRSAVKTLWAGGVKWRDTFYPLETLKKGPINTH
ncbi:MAG TPA: glycosyltransferase family 2 protein [bacterium]|nr:glycosyltransferase family 2 protein [bacterium]